MSAFTLYNYFRSSTSYRARIAMNLKGLSFEYKSVHLLNNGGEQHRAEYRELNPIGGVPTLVHEMNGRTHVIAQSMAIIEYLDEIQPTPHRFFPGAPAQRAVVRQMCENINADMHNFSNLKVLQYLDRELKTSPEQKEKWIHHWMQLGFTAVEELLKRNSGRYSFGDQVTAADLFLVPHCFTAARFNFDTSKFVNLSRVNTTCLEMPEFQAAHPSKQPDYSP